MPIVFDCEDIYEALEIVKELTGDVAHPNKIYQAIKSGGTYRGLSFAYDEDVEDLTKVYRVDNPKRIIRQN